MQRVRFLQLPGRLWLGKGRVLGLTVLAGAPGWEQCAHGLPPSVGRSQDRGCGNTLICLSVTTDSTSTDKLLPVRSDVKVTDSGKVGAVRGLLLLRLLLDVMPLLCKPSSMMRAGSSSTRTLFRTQNTHGRAVMTGAVVSDARLHVIDP